MPPKQKTAKELRQELEELKDQHANLKYAAREYLDAHYEGDEAMTRTEKQLRQQLDK